MSNDEARRHALAEFLRTRRARLHPSDVGLPTGGRRRAPGLRREEVAHLASVGTSWYTLMEQGRDIHPSEQVVESLARALKLTEDERRHLFLLARQHTPASIEQQCQEADTGLLQLVKNLDPHPAYLMTCRWDLLAWNRAAALLFELDEPAPPYSRNMLWRIITHPALRQRTPNWEDRARCSVAQLRAECGRYPGDPAFAALIADLHAACPLFAHWWQQHEVCGAATTRTWIWYPPLGELQFERVLLHAPHHPELKLVIFSATEVTAAALGRYVAAPARPTEPPNAPAGQGSHAKQTAKPSARRTRSDASRSSYWQS